jgi:hypothetical protein
MDLPEATSWDELARRVRERHPSVPGLRPGALAAAAAAAAVVAAAAARRWLHVWA